MAGLQTALKNSKIKKEKVVMLDNEDLQEIHKILLSMFDDILNICHKYGIKYQLSGGSTLGAIRHKGFIPWDDDMDINMPRTEIDKFVTALRKEYGDRYWVHVPGETEDYDSMMIKVIYKGINAKKITDSDKKENGLYIDIFIVENTFDNCLLRDIHGLGCMFFRYVLSCIRFKRTAGELRDIVHDDKTLNKYLRFRSFLGRIFLIIPLAWWTRTANKWTSLCKNNHSKYVVITAGSKQFFQELYERKKFNKSINAIFEGRDVNITADYDHYLKVLYGNYMEIPPKNKREQHVMLKLDKKALSETAEALSI